MLAPLIHPSFSFSSLLILFLYIFSANCDAVNETIDKKALAEKAREMFMHGFNSYMKYAYPADELMPLSCQGRIRGVTLTRGDVDDALGNFSLTLVDTLDTLVVVNAIDDFERSVKLVVENVKFDSDLVVSVFETNIRMVGGLLSAHILAKLVKSQEPTRLRWYNEQLLYMAVDLADRLLPAFNTTSGIPYGRVNLKYGMLSYLKEQRDTCTACGGTMMLEFAALSRLTGKSIYEEKARKAMDFLWAQRNRASDLMGTVLNVHSGDWVRRDAGIGAGIDSYYEYCLKTYILLGESSYLERFNKHYDAIMRYINRGPLFIDVHMHKPTVAARSFMDSLLAFWPGLQVLKGDLRSAIEFHEVLYQVIQKHHFLPEAFTHDLQVHWAQYPLRPEFIESTYLLYRATKDIHYLQVAKDVMESLDKYVRVNCGFAGVKDIRTMSHEDRMDSFVLSETFKYLYMIFAEPSDLPLDPDNYVLTTEAHFLPLSIGDSPTDRDHLPRRVIIDPDELMSDTTKDRSKKQYRSACPTSTTEHHTSAELSNYGHTLRARIQIIMQELTRQTSNDEESETCPQPEERLRAWAFSPSNNEHLAQLKRMGVQLQIQADGRVQMIHSAATAASPQWALMGMEFIQEMIASAAQMESNEIDIAKIHRVVQVVSPPIFGTVHFCAAPAHFGKQFNYEELLGEAVAVVPFRGCRFPTNAPSVHGRIAIIERQDCMFQEKARFAASAGAIGVIIVDEKEGSTMENSAPFAMSDDHSAKKDVDIPVVFLYNREGLTILNHLLQYPHAVLRMSDVSANPAMIFADYVRNPRQSASNLMTQQYPLENENSLKRLMVFDSSKMFVNFYFRFRSTKLEDNGLIKQKAVEDNIALLSSMYEFTPEVQINSFWNFVRRLAYRALGLGTYPTKEEFRNFGQMLSSIVVNEEAVDGAKLPEGPVTTVSCSKYNSQGVFRCYIGEL